jgi:hypothetical protein
VLVTVLAFQDANGRVNVVSIRRTHHMPTPAVPSSAAAPVRCYTRALKNARYLQEMAPDTFAKDPAAEGFGTGVPMEILRRLHRTSPDSAVLELYTSVAEVIRETPLPVPGRAARDALFSGTVYFAQVTFQTSGGNIVMPASDMNQIVQYAQHAIVPISEYAAAYGPNSVTISPALLTYTANVPTGNFTDADLQGWVNDMVSANGLSTNSCIFVISPQGISAPNVGGNSGYHGKANIPYVVAGVTAAGLTLADDADVYAMVVSHEIAEMVVDPNVGGGDPEVCDPCDINCNNLTRCYFDASDNFLGANQATPPGGFTFSYYVCAVVRPAGATNCPASSADCAYAPPVGVAWLHNDLTAAAGAPLCAGDPFGYTWSVDSTQHNVFRGFDAHIHELWFNGVWNHNDLTVAATAPDASGDPIGYTWDVDSTQHVIFVGGDAHIHELWFNGVWNHNDLTVAAGAPLPAGKPTGYTYAVDSTQHVVFRGGDAHIHELWFNGAWNHNDLTVAAGAPLAAGDPFGYTWSVDSTQHNVYRGFDGHIHELWFNGAWNHNDLTVAATAPDASGDPIGYTWDVDNTQHVIFVGADGHIHELWFNGAWNHNDLTVAAGSPPLPQGKPTGYAWAVDGTEHVVYRGSDNHVQELYL